MRKLINLWIGMMLLGIYYPSAAKTQNHQENLGIHRMSFPSTRPDQQKQYIKPIKIKKVDAIAAKHDVTQQLQALIADLKAYYGMNEKVSGYTIQIYAGGSRAIAFKTRNKLYKHYPMLTPEIQYQQPHFTVRVGRFLDRLEAYKWYIPIKKLIQQAIIRPAYFPNQPGVFKSINHDALTKNSQETTILQETPMP